MSYDAAVRTSPVIFWTLILLSAGMIARPIVHWVMEQFAQMLERLEPEERDGADREIYRTCGALESLNAYAWIVCGPFLLPVALWGAAMVLYGKVCLDKGSAQKPLD